MIIELDMSSSTPIYVQLRNQIVKGIGKGELKTGEKLPTVRQLASDAGVNTMTVNKAYQILKNEGFIRTDRRLGAFVSESIADDTDFTEKLESELELLSAEACLTGMSREEFLSMCDKMYSQMKPCTAYQRRQTMEIIMFIIFIVTNLFIILFMQFAYTHAYKYENGMYLNVHIPSSHKEDAEVTEIVTTGKCKMKHFQIANVIISIAICFIVFFNIAVFVLVYIIWMFAYIFGIIHIPNSSHRKMYALKIQNGWIIEAQRKKVYIDTSPIDVDDDEYWKTGYYYNPDDKHILIENRMQSGNYTFNYAKKGAWIFTGITCAITAGCIILVFVCMLPLINIQEKITLTNNNLTISAGGYTSEIDVNDITELKLLDELPDDSFLRTNGASTDSYDIGRYEGRTLGKCSLYVFDGYAPILMIKSDDTLVFVNSKEDGEIEKLYVELSQ